MRTAPARRAPECAGTPRAGFPVRSAASASRHRRSPRSTGSWSNGRYGTPYAPVVGIILNPHTPAYVPVHTVWVTPVRYGVWPVAVVTTTTGSGYRDRRQDRQKLTGAPSCGYPIRRVGPGANRARSIWSLVSHRCVIVASPHLAFRSSLSRMRCNGAALCKYRDLTCSRPPSSC